jgi:ABC-type hemin transport system ATPase subunit
MSGGERIWINECLTRAMALYLAQTDGPRYATLFSDEADGAFDAQHKRRFMAMKRRLCCASAAMRRNTSSRIRLSCRTWRIR